MAVNVQVSQANTMQPKGQQNSMPDRSLRSVFVGNIPYEASEEQLKEIFSDVGPVISFRLVFDRETGKPKGYGFCEYKDQETAVSAMRNLNGYELNGRSLRVDSAASEKNKEEEMVSAVAPEANPYGSPVAPDEAPSAITQAVASLPPEQMFELMKQMKLCIQNNPEEARQMLLQNPQLSYALLQAQVVMKIVSPEIAQAILYRQAEPPQPLQPEDQGPGAGPPDMHGPPGPPDMRGPPEMRGPPDMRGPPEGRIPPDAARGHDIRGPPDRREGGRGPPDEMRGPPDRRGPRDMRGPPGFESRGPPDAGDPRRNPMPDFRGPPDLRDNRGGPEFRGSHDPRGFERGRGPPDDRRGPPDPRSNQRGGGGGGGNDPRNSRGQEHGFDPRRERTAPPHGPGPDDRFPGAGQSSQWNKPGQPPPAAGNGPPAPPPAGANPPAGADVTPQDQEKAALIMQVLSLTDQQIALLPEDQRESIMVLKEQIARSSQ